MASKLLGNIIGVSFMLEPAKASAKFDKILLFAIDETMKYVMGEGNAAIIFNYLEANSCPKEQIPQKLELFSSALRDLIGNGRRQILGAACVLETTIAETFAARIGRSFDAHEPINFPRYIKQLKQAYIENQ